VVPQVRERRQGDWEEWRPFPPMIGCDWAYVMMAHVLRRLASPPGRLAKQCSGSRRWSTISPGDATSWTVLGHFMCPCGRKITAGYHCSFYGGPMCANPEFWIGRSSKWIENSGFLWIS
jgi:hypothetical protein